MIISTMNIECIVGILFVAHLIFVICDIDDHFDELEEEDDRLNVNDPDVASKIVKEISLEFEKFNQDLRKKDKNLLDITGMSNTQKLERTISGNSLN